MIGIPDVAVGAIIAALITGLVSLLGLIISKEQKISEFRQAWIDALRVDVGAVIAHTNAIYSATIAGLNQGPDSWARVRNDYIGINQAVAQIQLRLDHTKESSRAVLKSLTDLEGLLTPGHRASYEMVDAVEKRLVSETQVILNQEWARVQSGEHIYRMAKKLALAVFISCAVALAIFVLWHAIIAARDSYPH